MAYGQTGKSFFEQEKEEISRLEKKGSRKFLKLYDFGSSSLRAEIKKRPGHFFFLFITSFVGSVVTTTFALFGLSANILAQFASPQLQAKAEPPAKVEAKKVVETEKYDHLLLASKLRKEEDDFVIVDIRSEKDFEAGHIVTAVSIPVYETDLVTEKGDLDGEAVANAFQEVAELKKLVIVYGPNAYAVLPDEIAVLLSKEGVSIKPLAVGFKEWEFLNSK